MSIRGRARRPGEAARFGNACPRAMRRHSRSRQSGNVRVCVMLGDLDQTGEVPGFRLSGVSGAHCPAAKEPAADARNEPDDHDETNPTTRWRICDDLEARTPATPPRRNEPDENLGELPSGPHARLRRDETNPRLPNRPATKRTRRHIGPSEASVTAPQTGDPTGAERTQDPAPNEPKIQCNSSDFANLRRPIRRAPCLTIDQHPRRGTHS
jgi:hypothetical protein